MYYQEYQSSFSTLMMLSDGQHLTGLCFNSKMLYTNQYEKADLKVFDETRYWLDTYFSNKIPSFIPDLLLEGTYFQKEVWEILLTIPYQKTITYGEIASRIALKRGKEKMSAQAVGQAIKNNPIAIIIPCHRVIGKNNRLTGYRWGLDIKERLLKLEGII